MLPVVVVLALVLYLAKPEMWVKIDRLTGLLEVRKTRLGCQSKQPHAALPVASIVRIVAEQRACARSNKCRGCRAYTIMAYTQDGVAHMLTPSYDLKEQRATDEVCTMQCACIVHADTARARTRRLPRCSTRFV
jgi:hypothetical protein